MRSDKKKLVPTHTMLTPRRHAIVRPVGAHNAAGMVTVNNFLGPVIVAGGDVHQCAIGDNSIASNNSTVSNNGAIANNSGSVTIGNTEVCPRCAEKDRTIAILTETIHSLTRTLATMTKKEIEP